MTAAISVALISAFFFALAATLQQREAGLQTALGASDPRLLWRLAHRPWWLAGIVADIVPPVNASGKWQMWCWPGRWPTWITHCSVQKRIPPWVVTAPLGAPVVPDV